LDDRFADASSIIYFSKRNREKLFYYSSSSKNSTMDFARLQQFLQNMPGRNNNAAADTPMPDTAEKIQISSLSLLKMLKHGMLDRFSFNLLF
jgi:dTDP-4-dehydrorhamnose reductase